MNAIEVVDGEMKKDARAMDLVIGVIMVIELYQFVFLSSSSRLEV